MEKLNRDDFIKYKFLANVKYSLNGDNACFTVHEANLENNNYCANLWIYNGRTKTYNQLTASNEDRMHLWINDEIILFSSTRDPKDKEKVKEGPIFTQFYTINLNGGEAKKAFRIHKKVTSIQQIQEDTYILTATFNPDHKDLESLSDEEKKQELDKRKEEKDYEVLDEIPFWSNGVGFTNKQRN